MLVADEFLGGSGAFLVGYSSLRRQGIPAVGVATTRPVLQRVLADPAFTSGIYDTLTLPALMR
jgi:hypothetical protein